MKICENLKRNIDICQKENRNLWKFKNPSLNLIKVTQNELKLTFKYSLGYKYTPKKYVL